ncbi:MAG: hypothetical protein J0M18_00110 [Ignavibacteria bacterium]|nr:hypothetical protein [Ignavibacteria bacterium]
MYNTQTIEILRKLDKDELKRFGDFLKSPFFNNSSFIVKIYEAAKKEYPAYTGSSLEPEKMFKKLYPSESFKDTRIRNLYAEFGNLLRKFLGYIEVESSELEFDIFVANSLARRNLGNISNKVINKTMEQYSGKIFWDDNYFLPMYSLYSTYIQNLNAGSKDYTKEHYSTQMRIQEVLIVLFFRELFILLSLQSFKKITPNAYTSKITIEEFTKVIDMKNLFTYLESSENPYAAYIKLHYLLYYFNENTVTEEEYYEIKKELYKIIFDVMKQEAFSFIVTIIRAIFIKLIPIDKKFYGEIFELSKLFCKLKIFPNKHVPYLASGPFKDMFGPAVILMELDWAENFVKEYSQYLMEDIREDQYNYCMGNISFKRKNYELSLEYLNKIKMSEMSDKVNIRFFYMMNFIELKAYENALSSLQTIRQFYNDRKDIPEIFAVLIPDAIKYFGEIIKCETEGIKLEPQIYAQAKDGRRYYHAKYVLGKMEKLML